MVGLRAIPRQKRDPARLAAWFALLLVLLGLAAGTPSFASPATGAPPDLNPAVLKSELATLSAPAKATRLFESRVGSGADAPALLDVPTRMPGGAAAYAKPFRARHAPVSTGFGLAQPRAPPVT